MTPHEAEKRLEELSETARKHPRKARRKTIELLCEIARKNGFYRCADFYETFKDED